jgi:hypothetical protein
MRTTGVLPIVSRMLEYRLGMVYLSLNNAGLRSMDCDVPDCTRAKYRANFAIRLFCFICFKLRTSARCLEING